MSTKKSSTARTNIIYNNPFYVNKWDLQPELTSSWEMYEYIIYTNPFYVN